MSHKAKRKKNRATNRAKPIAKTSASSASVLNSEVQKPAPNAPGGNAGQDQENEVTARKSLPAWIVGVAEIFGGIVFAHFSQACFSTDHKIAGLWCVFSGIVFSILIP